jgi:hypothetical protein
LRRISFRTSRGGFSDKFHGYTVAIRVLPRRTAEYARHEES